MIGHHYLRTLGDENFRLRNARGDNTFNLLFELFNIERHTVAYNIDGSGLTYARGQQMERKLTVIVDDGMTGVRTALETNDHIGLRGEHIGNFSLTLIAPVSSDNCSDHNFSCTSAKNQILINYILYSRTVSM